MVSSVSWRRLGAWVLIGHFLVWWLSAAMSPGLDGFGDMHELYAWGHDPQWGTFKHPPLLAWAAGAWFAVWPTADWAFELLSALNMTLAVWLVGRFTRDVLAHDAETDRWTTWAMVGAALSLAYGHLALKLNMNSVLLPLWPLAGWAFWRAMTRPGWWPAVALGLAAAAAMLGKYYSGVLLVSMLLAALACAPGRRWLLSRWSWISLAVFALALLPHVVWVAHHGFVTLLYVEEKGGGHSFALRGLLSFVVMLFVFPVLSALVLWWSGRPWRRVPSSDGRTGALLALVAGPPLLTVVLAALVNIRLSAPWGLPLAFAWPALVLAWVRPGGPGDAPLMAARLWRALRSYWLVVVLAGVAYYVYEAERGSAKYYLPRAELAQALQAEGRPVGWVGGDWRYASALTFYLPGHPHGVPGLPGEAGPAQVHTPADWRSLPGLVVCDPTQGPECLAQAQAWVQRLDLRVETESVTVHRSGWRFPVRRDSQFDLLWVAPSASAEVAGWAP